jgi:hypothetical protein
MSAGLSCCASAAWFISCMSAAEMRPASPSSAFRTCGYRSSVDARATGTASYGGKYRRLSSSRKIAERQVHRLRRRAKREPVGLREAGVSIRTLEELVAERRPPPGRHPRHVVDGAKAARARLVAANQNRERVVVAERGQQRAAAGSIEVPHAVDDRLRILERRLPEDRGQRRAGVLDIHVDIAAEQRAIADQRAAEIQSPLDRQARLALDRLRDDLAENDLLGEVLRADDDRT